MARVHLGTKGSGLPLRIPALDLIEIGAGGGSIAHVDVLGLLWVGPRSGADPGPACYGRGGKEPTVTDADLLLGYLAADRFLGGEMRLDIEAARGTVAAVAEPLGLDVIEAAAGIHRVVNENMASAACIHILEKGKDPRRYPLFTFGGREPRAALGGHRSVWFGKFVRTPVYQRSRLGAGSILRGPAVVEERESTLVVPPGARMAIDRRGNADVTLPTRMQ